MLSPEYLAGCADGILKLYRQLEDDIVRDMVRRLVSTDWQMTQSAVWQMEKAQELGLHVYGDIVRRLAQITGKTTQELKELFEDGGTETLRYDDRIYRQAGLNPLPVKQSPGMLQVLTAGYKKCGQTLKNLTLTTASEAQQLFITSCNRAYMQVSSGAFDYNTAIRKAVEAFGSSGATVRYPTGHRDKTDVAVRRAVMTGVSQTCGQLQEMRLDEMDCDLVETTAHMGARLSHSYWQGQVFSRSGKHRKYPDFVASTGYGSGEGLMGWNCRHGFYPFFEGLSERAYSKEMLTEWKQHTVSYNGKTYTDYEASQKQRELERGIRDTKRTLLGIEEGKREADDELRRGLEEDFAAKSVKLKKQEQALADFLKQTGREEERARVQTAGFGRGIAQRAVQANKKELIKQRERDIIKEVKKCGIQGDIELNPKAIDLKGFAFDDKHINSERAHGVSRQEAEAFAHNAKFVSVRWSGRFRNYYSGEGAVYIDTHQNNIRTAFKADEFSKEVIEALEVLKKYGR